MIRVFLADDHAIVRDGLRKNLTDEPDITVVGEAPSGDDVLARAQGQAWDVLVLDLSMPGLPAVELVPKLRALRPALAIIILSMYPEAQHGPYMMRLGAAAYLSKGRPPNEILDAIRKVSAGEKYVTAEVASGLLDTTQPAHASLSPREREIFMMLARGGSPSDIAGALDLSATTISTYFTRIRTKLGVTSNMEVVQYAFREGLVA